VNDASISGTPSGTFVANSTDFEDVLNPNFPGGGKVVYNGTESPQIITGLTNGTNYYFKTFVNSYGFWSDGVETDCMPVFIENINNSFKLYPNPVSNILNIENTVNSGIYTVELFNITGKSVFKTISSDKLLQLSLADFSKGIYILEISTDIGIFRERIIIE